MRHNNFVAGGIIAKLLQSHIADFINCFDVEEKASENRTHSHRVRSGHGMPR